LRDWKELKRSLNLPIMARGLVEMTLQIAHSTIIVSARPLNVWWKEWIWEGGSPPFDPSTKKQYSLIN